MPYRWDWGIIGTVLERSNLEVKVEHIEKVLDGIRRDVRGIAELNASMASMKTSIEVLKESVSQRISVVEQKAEKTENRLWYIVIAVIIAGGVPTLVAKFWS